MIEKYLWIAGTLPLLILGTLHLIYTFFSNKFSSTNKSLEEEMKISFPVITRKITMWKAWIGFNASHSIGAMFIGAVNLFIATFHFSILQNSIFYLLLNIVTILFYLWLAKKYWFSIPLIGVTISSCCFVTAGIIILVK